MPHLHLVDSYCVRPDVFGSTTVDPGFIERGFIYIKVWGFALLILSHFSEISFENEIIWSH